MFSLRALKEMAQVNEEKNWLTYEEKEAKWIDAIESATRQGKYSVTIDTVHKNDMRIFSKKLNEKSIYCTMEEFANGVVARILWC